MHKLIGTAIFALGFAVSAPLFADDNGADRLDRKGDRIERRLDRRADQLKD